MLDDITNAVRSISERWLKRHLCKSLMILLLEGESHKVVESHDDERLRIIFEKKSDKNGRSRARDREMNTNAMTGGNENQVASKCKV